MKKFLIVLSASVCSIILQASASAISISGSRDNDANAVIRNGAMNCSELQTGYSQTGVSDIYTHFGISSQDINNCDNAVEGIVTNRNNVWIHKSSGQCPNLDTTSLTAQQQQAVKDNPNLCLVATNAMTAGRQNISGSTAVTSGSTTFYMRPPSVSFVSSSLPAFVVMNNNRFEYAILASCGNPVKATPVTTVTKTTVTPQVKSSVTTTPLTQSQTQSQTVVVNQPAPVVTTTTTPAQPAPAPAKTLPNTGAGGVIGLAGISTVLGTVGHFVYTRRRLFS